MPGKSRLSLAQDAVRTSLKARLLLPGVQGSGKTWTGLSIAEVLADGGPIIGVDSEKESMLTYADDFTFRHLPWNEPYDPRELADTIMDAGDSYAVVFIDSLTHFWTGSDSGGSIGERDTFMDSTTPTPLTDELRRKLEAGEEIPPGCYLITEPIVLRGRSPEPPKVA